MKDYLKNGEGEQLNATAGTVAEQIASMRDTVNGPAWTIASFIPVYGDDIKLVRGMMEQADILAQDAMLPACAQLEDFKLGNLLTDGAVNIDMLKGLITTIQDVEPVVTSSIDAIDALPEPHIGKIKSLMDRVTGPMDTATPSRILARSRASWTGSPAPWTPPRRSSPTSTRSPPSSLKCWATAERAHTSSWRSKMPSCAPRAVCPGPSARSLLKTARLLSASLLRAAPTSPPRPTCTVMSPLRRTPCSPTAWRPASLTPTSTPISLASHTLPRDQLLHRGQHAR